jgi:hypothetical protein
MRAKRKRDSEIDSDLVDPSFDAPLEEATEPAKPQPNAKPPLPNPRASQPSGSVLVGGGEKQARAYVPPTALPSLGPQEADTSSKVAISNDIDPRRMPTVKIPEERKKKSAAAGARPAPLDADGVPRPAPPGFSAPETDGEDGTPSKAAPRGRSSTLIWAVAVTLAAVLGAGAAYGVRKSMTRKDAPSGQPPAKTAPAKP